jgi:hypothetical protein
MHIELWLKDLEGIDHLGVLGIAGRSILKLILKKYGLRQWTGLNCFREGSGCGLLSIWL